MMTIALAFVTIAVLLMHGWIVRLEKRIVALEKRHPKDWTVAKADPSYLYEDERTP